MNHQNKETPEQITLPDCIDLCEGQSTAYELQTLAFYAKQVPYEQDIVEIGSFRGRTALALALGAHLGNGQRIYAVDPHVNFIGPLGGRFGPDDSFHMQLNLQSAGKYGRLIEMVEQHSETAARNWDTEEALIGLLLIDGNHDAAREDYELWKNGLASDAIVIFHDIDYPPIAQTIADLVDQHELLPGLQFDGMSVHRRCVNEN